MRRKREHLDYLALTAVFLLAVVVLRDVARHLKDVALLKLDAVNDNPIANISFLLYKYDETPEDAQLVLPDGFYLTTDANGRIDLVNTEAGITNQIQSFDPAPRTVTLVNADGTSETVMVDPSTIQPDGSEYGAVLSNFVILAEDKMRTIAWIAAVLVAFAGTWLTVMTFRDFRKT